MKHLLNNGTNNIEIRAVAEGIFRVRISKTNTFSETLLERYNLISEPDVMPESYMTGNTVTVGDFSATLDGDCFTFSGGCKEPFTISVPSIADNNGGFTLNIPLNKKEGLYGIGDVNRETINKRGLKATMWIKNVFSYGPCPYIMSSRGWGILINCTYLQEYDLGATDPDKIVIDAKGGPVDLYIFLADTMKETLSLYTTITGRPIMLPKAAYGVTQVCNEEYGAHELLNDCMMFRKSDIPCDIMGLEPSWMDKHYDFSVDKKWANENNRFYIPCWLPENSTGPFTFFYNLRKMGYKLSLWLCCDYDLLWEEEHTNLIESTPTYDGATIFDEHFGHNSLMDKFTKPGEPWFEHLKKFVDNGASAFKLDGANQINEHPDRLWAGKYLDDEVHNMYPLVYAKQMKEGFSEYTKGRRAMIYTPAFYAGMQKYAATWAGDTGGGADTLVSVLNLALSGNANSSCDMDTEHIEGIHYGFLMPWSQVLSWRSWSLPWFLGDEIEDVWRRYAKLRSSLFPYIYSTAHNATRTGIPIMRPLCLIFPEEDSTVTDATNMYMFGENFLVAAFDMNICLPKGKWRDMFTGRIYEGGESFTYEIPEGYGGGLFAKEGSVWVTQQPKPHIDSPIPSEYTINIYPGKDCDFTLVEDDGVTYGYLNGEVAETKVYVKNSTADGFSLILKQRTGGYTVDSDVEYDVVHMSENHYSNVRPLPDVTGFDVKVFVEKVPASAILNGKAIDTTYENGTLFFNIPKELHEADDVTVEIKY